MSATITVWPGLNADKPGKRRGVSPAVLDAWIGLDWPPFAGKMNHRGWSPGTFRDNHRDGESFEQAFAIGLDLDHGVPSIAEALAPFEGIEGTWHETKSSTPEAPRLRIVLWLSRPVDAGEYRTLWRFYSGRSACPVDTATSNPDRFWYCPTAGAQSGRLEGQPIDVDAVLDEVGEREAIAAANELPPPKPRARVGDGAGKPGADFARRTSWASILEPHGWTRRYQKGDNVYWRRPNHADKRAVSASSNADYLVVWSSNAAPLQVTRKGSGLPCYDKLGAFAALEHGGDLRTAVRALAAAGYGEQRPRSVGAAAAAEPWDGPGDLPPEACEQGYGETGELVRAMAERTAPRIQWLGARDIFAPLPPTKWVVRDLQLCPGRPILFAGYGASGKTLAVQSMAMSLAAGRPIWGRFAIDREFNVCHFDHEQGQHASRKRYQRLGRGMQIDPAEVDGRLRLACFPDLRLNSSGAEEAYVRELDGVDFAFGDSLRAMTPGVDENDSAIREQIDMLTRVEERTGCAFALLAHSGKDSPGRTDKRQLVRGSGGIFDACGAVYLLQGAGNGPKEVTQTKAPAEGVGRMLEPFALEICDVPLGADPFAGVLVVVREHATTDADLGAAVAGMAALEARVLAAVAAKPGATARQLRQAVKARHDDVLAALDGLLGNGKVRRERAHGHGGGWAHHVVSDEGGEA